MANKHLPDTFAATTTHMSTEGLRNAILAAVAKIGEVEETRDNDEQFQELKENYKTYAGSFSDVLKAEKAKIVYLKEVLKERGQTISDTTTATQVRSQAGGGVKAVANGAA